MNFVCNIARVFKLNAILKMIYLITSSLSSTHFFYFKQSVFQCYLGEKWLQIGISFSHKNHNVRCLLYLVSLLSLFGQEGLCLKIAQLNETYESTWWWRNDKV